MLRLPAPPAPGQVPGRPLAVPRSRHRVAPQVQSLLTFNFPQPAPRQRKQGWSSFRRQTASTKRVGHPCGWTGANWGAPVWFATNAQPPNTATVFRFLGAALIEVTDTTRGKVATPKPIEPVRASVPTPGAIGDPGDEDHTGTLQPQRWRCAAAIQGLIQAATDVAGGRAQEGTRDEVPLSELRWCFEHLLHRPD
jgi:hypothetical protein